MNSNKNPDLDWLKEPLSSDYKNKILNSVQIELEKNKALLSPNRQKNLNWIWSLVATLSFAAMIGLRISGLLDFSSPTTTFDDLALLTPEEFEIVENLDILDSIESIDLDEIRKEMSQEENNS